MNKIPMLFLTAALIAAPARAFSTCPQCATEMTQVMNNVQLAQSYLTQVQQLQQQIGAYQELLRSGVRLTQSQWTDALGQLRDLTGIVQQGRALAYSMENIDQAFRSTFVDYDRTAAGRSHLYSDWTETTLDSIKGALMAAGLQSRNMQSEHDTMSALRSLSNGSVGQMQALQVGNQISAEMVGQLQKLRQLQMAHMQAQSSYMASSAAEQEENRRVVQEYWRLRSTEERQSEINAAARKFRGEN